MMARWPDVESNLSLIIFWKSAQMADSLGRSLETVKPPIYRAAWLLPQSAYRLLMDFLRCETTFCNHIVPHFHEFGWVTLRPTRVKEPEEDSRAHSV